MHSLQPHTNVTYAYLEEMDNDEYIKAKEIAVISKWDLNELGIFTCRNSF